MSPQLTVHNAQLSTATVTIQKVTVDSKQVTLAVFRQLLDEDLINEDGELNGVPWGTVNYHPDKCAEGSSHLHVVWQKDDKLRRARVNLPSWWNTHFFSEGADDLIQAAYCLNGHTGRDDWKRYGWNEGSVRGRGIRFELDGMACEAVWEPSSPSFSPSGHQRDGHTCLTQDDYDKCLHWVREDIVQEKERRARITGHWKALNDLPQLFIAV